MPPKSPSFWQHDGMMAKMLSPLSCLYTVGHNIKWSLSKPYVLSVPVFCIGGVVAGGSGKTPTLHAFLSLIHENGLYKNPVILLRGYGGTIKSATLVDPSKHTYKDVGDEALLHSYLAPTIVAANRADGARLAEQIGADIILMDDGLQNNTLAKTISVLVIDGLQGLGNGRVLPAGPLREKLSGALMRVSAVVQIGGGDPNLGTVALKASIFAPSASSNTAYVAFAGLGHPEKFRRTLVTQGFNVTDFIPFPDHHPYNDADIISLKAIAAGKTLITTAKDFVRIPPAQRDGINVLPIALQFEDPAAAIELLKAAS